MDEPAPTGGKRRGRRILLAAIVLLAISPLVLFGASNLWLSTVGKNLLAEKIARKTTLETRLGNASWSPWNGISLNEIEISQPEALRSSVAKPLAKIGKIRLRPVWRECLRGKLEVSSIEIDSPEIVLPVQILAFLSQSAQPSPQPPLAAPVPPAPDAPPPVPAPVGPPAVVQNPPLTNAGPKPVAPPQPTGWVHIRDGSFSLVSAGLETPLLEILDLTTQLPVAGDGAKSSVLLGAIKTLGAPVISKLSAPLTWQAPVLTLGPAETEIQGLKFNFGGQLGLISGLPLKFEIAVPKQQPRPVDVPGGFHGEAQDFAAHARFGGLLVAPPSWQGDLIIESMKPVFNRGEEKANFDRGSAVVVLRNGTLACVDARLVGDELSFLGNGRISANGQVAAVLRAVAAPQNLVDQLKKILPGINAAPVLTPLSTPQRAALDLEATGQIGNIQLRLGKGGPVIGSSAIESPPNSPK